MLGCQTNYPVSYQRECRGTMKADRMPVSIGPVHLRDALLQTLEVRRGIEVEAGMVAARKRTAEDLVIIEAKLNAMERVQMLKGAAGPEDLAFHLAVYDATHNPL